ncbi:MAG: hypothetical protein JW908_13830 [Anaerolineales bacterium]|nr:hypothetical protein [Anaerolineales bacterium]
MMWRCPKCGSTRLEQYRMPYGPMWCLDCFFRVEEKSISPNPFYIEDEDQAQPSRPGLGEQLAAGQKKKRRKKP